MNRMGKEASLEGLKFDGETVLCRVCGDKASGFHYGVHACEGCKGFFRRSIQQKINYRPCLKNQMCNVMRANRNRCQYCRFKKCIEVGMSRDAVRFGRVPKSEKARIMKQMQMVNSQGPTSEFDNLMQNTDEIVRSVLEAHQKTNEYSRERLHNLRKAAIENNSFECNVLEQTSCPVDPNSFLRLSNDSQSFKHMSDNCAPVVTAITDFAQLIPAFLLLCKDDQITLLKAGTFEVLLVRLASLFDSESNTILFTSGQLRKRKQCHQVNGCGSRGFLLDSMFDFADHFNKLNVKENELALFSAIVLFSHDRPGLRNVEQIRKLQDILLKSLESLVTHNHIDDPTYFSKLMRKTTDLRTINTLHSEKLVISEKKASDYDTQNHFFPPDLQPQQQQHHMEVDDINAEGNLLNNVDSLCAPNPMDSCPMRGNMESSLLTTQKQVLKNSNQSPQVFLQTPYGLFLRDESRYNFIPEQPRPRCHTLDRDTVPRSKLHRVDDGTMSRRRTYTLDREYLTKVVSKLSDRLEKRAAIRGDSKPPSISNSAASSPIPEENQQPTYLNNRDFVSIATVESSTSSSRGSPMPDRDLHIPYSSSPSSPHPRPRSDSAGTDDLAPRMDYAPRPRCYSFHDGRASRPANVQHLPDVDRISVDSSQTLLVPDMRRRSVGASYGLHTRKASLLIDIHPSDLSRTANQLLKSEETRTPCNELPESARYLLTENSANCYHPGVKIDPTRTDLEHFAYYEPRPAPHAFVTKPDFQISEELPPSDSIVGPLRIQQPVPDYPPVMSTSTTNSHLSSPSSSSSSSSSSSISSSSSSTTTTTTITTTNNNNNNNSSNSCPSNSSPLPTIAKIMEPPEQEIFHKKFDKLRKHAPHSSKAGASAGNSNTAIITNTTPTAATTTTTNSNSSNNGSGSSSSSCNSSSNNNNNNNNTNNGNNSPGSVANPYCRSLMSQTGSPNTVQQQQSLLQQQSQQQAQAVLQQQSQQQAQAILQHLQLTDQRNTTLLITESGDIKKENTILTNVFNGNHSINSTNKSKLSAGEAHPQLLAHLQAPNPSSQTTPRHMMLHPYSLLAPGGSPVNIGGHSPSPSSSSAQGLAGLHSEPITSSVMSGHSNFRNNLQNVVNGTIYPQSGPHLVASLEEQKRLANESPNHRYQVHAAAVSHLKDKILKRMDSIENLSKECGGGSNGEPPMVSQATNCGSVIVLNSASPNEINTSYPTSVTGNSPTMVVTSQMGSPPPARVPTGNGGCSPQQPPPQHLPQQQQHSQASPPNLGYSGMLPPRYPPQFLHAYSSLPHVGGHLHPGYSQQLASLPQISTVNRTSVITTSLGKPPEPVDAPLNLTVKNDKSHVSLANFLCSQPISSFHHKDSA